MTGVTTVLLAGRGLSYYVRPFHSADCDSLNTSHNPGEDIGDCIQRFDSLFYDLVTRLQNEVMQNRLSVVKFRYSLTLLPTPIRTEHYLFIKENSKDIQNADDIEDFFCHLNLYWTYLEYSLLNHIIEQHSGILSIDLKEDMKRYKKDMDAFKQRTTVGQILGVGLGCVRREPPPGFDRIVTRLKKKASEFTLEKLDQFRRRICLEFNLPTFILMLESVDEGSLCIKWHIPSSEVHFFMDVSSAVLTKISGDSALFYLQVDKSLPSGEGVYNYSN